jgi:ubiquinone/menaquinone biosynthesis C-methylase UbiE
MSEQNDNNVKKSIRGWWASNPMTYGREHGTTDYVNADGTRRHVEIGSREFFEHADQTFYQWNQPLHTPVGYFGKIFDYERYRGKRVLEVGCGMGCMAMNWAQHGALVTAVDLNPVAIQQTRKRFEVYGLQGDIREADGEQLPFADDTFDYAYSWGVLHHSPDTKTSVEHVLRVVKPGAEVGVMLYHRESFLYKFLVEYVEGYLHLENDFLSPLQLASRYGDGAQAEGNPHTWPVTKQEAYDYLFEKFENVNIQVLGTDIDSIFDFWFPALSRVMPKPMLKALARRWGWSLWITGVKPR